VKLRVLDLFSGIGGFSLGLERTGGFETVAFCEIEDFPRRILAKHWPDVPCYTDVRELTGERLASDGIAVDVICGGFPCQDISVAGKGAGLAGERSGLWSEIARLVSELEPRFVIVENVSALLARGLGNVLGDLASLGYDAEWHCIPASAVGALHYRDRFWMVAHADYGQRNRSQFKVCARRAPVGLGSKNVADPAGELSHRSRQRAEQARISQSSNGSENVPDTDDAGRIKQWRGFPISAQLASAQRGGWWRVEPDVGRVANGVPSRVDRLRCLGNAVVPQIPELIGNAILQSIEDKAA
jgi:DNA (cytosine-5)-methyltransferase 1